MHGFLRYPFHSCVTIAVMCSLLFLAGCSGSEESARPSQQDATLESFLRANERSFDPTRYELPPGEIQRQEQLRAASSDTSVGAVSVAPDTVAGFRVQILLTEEIDRATETRDSLMTKLPGEWVYIVYDAPNYKVRVGNFVDRPAGNRMAEHLARMGFVDAWVVPDLVISNAPPRPALPIEEPLSPEEQPPNNR